MPSAQVLLLKGAEGEQRRMGRQGEALPGPGGAAGGVCTSRSCTSLPGSAAAPARAPTAPWMLPACKIPDSWSEGMRLPCAMESGV